VTERRPCHPHEDHGDQHLVRKGIQVFAEAVVPAVRVPSVEDVEDAAVMRARRRAPCSPHRMRASPRRHQRELR
jgi:hypothetical protein